MNLLNLISEIEKVDPEVYGRLDSRRRVFKHLSGMGGKVAVAAVPALFSGILHKAYGQTTTLPTAIADVLNFALKLEYLESLFYIKGTGTANLIPAGAATTALGIIRDDEVKHVAFLRTALGSQAGPVLTDADFDFTGAKGGTRPALFPTVFSDYQTFLAVAQSLEDTGVRAYKGAAPSLMSNKTVLEAALDIHSVEARHASHLRTMRRGNNGTLTPSAPANPNSMTPKSWVSNQDGGGAAPAATAAIYGAGTPAASFPAEDNVTQGGVNLQTALASLNFTKEAITEAFDEPLDTTTVAAIAVNFFIRATF